MGLTAVLSTLNIPTLEKRVMMLRQGRSFLESAGIVGKGLNFPVMLKDNLQKEKGDTVRFPLLANLKGATTASGAGAAIAPFTTDTTKLQGREEAMIYSISSASVDVSRCAVKLDGELTDQQMAVQIWDDALPLLKKRVSDRKDQLLFTAVKMTTEYDVTTGGLTKAPNAVAVLDGEASTWAGVAASQTLSIQRIKQLAYLADMRGIDEVEIPGVGLVRGVLIVSPGAARDLKNDPDYEEALRLAQPRDKSNPIFSGSWVNVDGVYIFTNRCTLGVNGSTAGSFLRQAALDATHEKVENIFLGAGAVGYARVYDFKVIKDALDDYGDQPSLGGKTFCGFVKTTINDGDYSTAYTRDFGVIYVPTSQPKASA